MESLNPGGATLRTQITINRRGTWAGDRARDWKLGWASSVGVDGVANGSTRSRVDPWWPGGVARKVGGELGESGALGRAPAHLPASPGFPFSDPFPLAEAEARGRPGAATTPSQGLRDGFEVNKSGVNKV